MDVRRIECKVLRESAAGGFVRAHVKLSWVTPGGTHVRHHVTNAEGVCVFDVDAEALGAGATLQVFDARGRPLTDALPVARAAAGEPEPAIALSIPESAIAEAALPRQPRGEPLLPDSIWVPVSAALERATRETDLARGLKLDELTCGLPPLLTMAGLTDLAFGVLEGRTTDFAALSDALSNLNAWSRRKVRNPGDLDARHLEPLLRQASARRATAGAPVTLQGAKRVSRQRLIPSELLGAIALGTLRVNGEDPASMARDVMVLHHQLGALEGLHRLLALTESARTGGTRELEQFLSAFRALGKACGNDNPASQWIPDGHPHPPFGVTDDPYDIPEDTDMLACLAEALRQEPPLARSLSYEIVSVEPLDACPGDTITLSGTNLLFESHRPHVRFSGRRGWQIIAEPLEGASSTQLSVVVPPGAVCGPLELHTDAARRFGPACGDVRMFHGPRRPFHFRGGATAITHFSAEVDPASCPTEGTDLLLAWSACNARSFELTVVGPQGTSTRPVPASGMRLPLPPTYGLAEVKLTLRAVGCGSHQASHRVFVGRDLSTLEDVRVDTARLESWHGVKRTRNVVRPQTLQQLIAAIVQAEARGEHVGIKGSDWSYSDCVVAKHGTRTDLVVETDALTGIVGAPLPNYLSSLAAAPKLDELPNVVDVALREAPSSVLSQQQLAEFKGETLPLKKRLVHVRGGTKLAHLSWLLKEKGLAMATLGGSNGQSLAGTISTGTHGTNCRMPPIADFVRALHIVGAGGVQWWIEPASKPITDPGKMEQRKRNQRDPHFDRCLRVVYDDQLFNAALVAVGAAGVIYSVVLEAAPLHRLRSSTSLSTWERARDVIAREVLGPRPPFFMEIVVGPRSARITRREPVPMVTPPDAVTSTLAGSEGLGWALALHLAPLLVTTLPAAIAAYLTARLAEAAVVGARNSRLGDQIAQEARRTFNLMSTLIATLGRAIEHRETDESLADAIVQLINLLWETGALVVDGPGLVGELQEQVIAALRPAGEKSALSFTVYNDQTTHEPMKHAAFERRIESYEYVMRAENVVGFVDAVRELARSTTKALISTINVRFTAPTRALIGMQQHSPLTGYVEIWTIRGLRGSRAFHQQLEQLAARRRVHPHWGHYHRQHLRDVRYEGHFPNLDQWRDAMRRLAEPGPLRDTFFHGFVRERGLIV